MKKRKDNDNYYSRRALLRNLHGALTSVLLICGIARTMSVAQAAGTLRVRIESDISNVG